MYICVYIYIDILFIHSYLHLTPSTMCTPLKCLITKTQFKHPARYTSKILTSIPEVIKRLHSCTLNTLNNLNTYTETTKHQTLYIKTPCL